MTQTQLNIPWDFDVAFWTKQLKDSKCLTTKKWSNSSFYIFMVNIIFYNSCIKYIDFLLLIFLCARGRLNNYILLHVESSKCTCRLPKMIKIRAKIWSSDNKWYKIIQNLFLIYKMHILLWRYPV
jgi:hypothetical protein